LSTSIQSIEAQNVIKITAGGGDYFAGTKEISLLIERSQKKEEVLTGS
jgi:hypothetical protein